MEAVIVNEVICDCKCGLDGRVHHCKLSTHFNHFDQIKKNIMVNNLGSKEGRDHVWDVFFNIKYLVLEYFKN